MKYKVSVIVPIYGVEKFIARCAESLMHQSLKEVEYIFVNDCTNDASMIILKNILIKYPNKNYKIINKNVNEGLPQARKSGVEIATGEYIYLIDSDDWLENSALEEMYNFVSKTNADILCCGFFKDYDDHIDLCLGDPVSSPSMGIRKMLYSEEKLHSGVWAKLVRRDLYLNVTFPPSYMHEDLVLMVQLFYCAKTIVYLPKAFYHYMQNNVNSIVRQDSAKRYVSAAINFHFLIDFMKREGIEVKYRKELMYRINAFKTFSIVDGRLLDPSLYCESNKFIFSCNAVNAFMPKFYTFCAIHNFPFIWIFVHKMKTFLKKV